MSYRFLGFFVWGYLVVAVVCMMAGNVAAGFSAIIMSTLFQFELRRHRADAHIENEIASLVARARAEGWYEDDPGWSEVDRLLELRRHPPESHG